MLVCQGNTVFPHFEHPSNNGLFKVMKSPFEAGVQRLQTFSGLRQGVNFSPPIAYLVWLNAVRAADRLEGLAVGGPFVGISDDLQLLAGSQSFSCHVDVG